MESSGKSVTGNGTQNYNQVAAYFGCSTAASPLACLRKVSSADMLSYISTNSIAFDPVVGDGTFLLDVRPSVNSGKFAKVPLLIGTNKDEGRAFVALAGFDFSAPATNASVENGVQSATGLNLSTIVPQILANITSSVGSGTFAVAGQ
jgi:carboxylesterase 2